LLLLLLKLHHVVQAARGYPQNLHTSRAPDRHNSKLNVALERRVVLITLLSGGEKARSMGILRSVLL
jgi:hypothetical protein